MTRNKKMMKWLRNHPAVDITLTISAVLGMIGLLLGTLLMLVYAMGAAWRAG